MNISYVEDLKKLTKQLLEKSRYHLNEADNKIAFELPINRVPEDSMESGAIPYKSYYDKPGKRLQYDTWNSRNSSKQFCSNLKWNVNSESMRNTHIAPLSGSFPALNKPQINTVHSSDSNNNKSKLKRNIVCSGVKKSHQKSNPKHGIKSYCGYNTNRDITWGGDYTKSKESFGNDYTFNDYGDNSEEYSTDDTEFKSTNFLDKWDAIELKSLHNFRNEFYFECHSLEDKLKNVSYKPHDKHICQHHYTVDERLFPQPLYADHEQNSRCRICHLPLDVNTKKTDNIEATKKTDHILKKSVFPKFSNSRIYHCKISDPEESDDASDISTNNVNDNPEILLKFPYKNFFSIPKSQYVMKDSIDHLHGHSSRHVTFSKHSDKQNEAPSDSLALRYQKGFRKLL